MSFADAESPDERKRLDEITTQWSLLRLSHEDSVSRAGPARRTLVLRYSSAIRSYVGALMRDQQDADEVAQEAVVRLLKGDFAGATPKRGRFRDLLKVSVRNMVRSYWRKQQRQRGVPLIEESFAADDKAELQRDSDWLAAWQRSVLSMTYDALRAYQQSTPGSVAYAVLRLRTDHADDTSDQLAERLSAATGKSYNAAATRQQLRRARLRFAQLLIEEIARGLADPSPLRVKEELIEVGFMQYVGDFLPDDWQEHGQLRM